VYRRERTPRLIDCADPRGADYSAPTYVRDRRRLSISGILALASVSVRGRLHGDLPPGLLTDRGGLHPERSRSSARCARCSRARGPPPSAGSLRGSTPQAPPRRSSLRNIFVVPRYRSRCFLSARPVLYASRSGTWSLAPMSGNRAVNIGLDMTEILLAERLAGAECLFFFRRRSFAWEVYRPHRLRLPRKRANAVQWHRLLPADAVPREGATERTQRRSLYCDRVASRQYAKRQLPVSHRSVSFCSTPPGLEVLWRAVAGL